MSKKVDVRSNQSEPARESVERRIAVFTAKVRTRTADDIIDHLLFAFDELYQSPMTPQNANAMCNIAGKVTRVHEMQEKYGRSTPAGEQNSDRKKTLALIPTSSQGGEKARVV